MVSLSWRLPLGAGRMRLRSWLLPIVAAVAAVEQVFDPAPAWRILLLSAVALGVLSYLWARNLAQSLTITRGRRYGWAQVGDRLEEHFELMNTSGFPLLWVEIEDESTLPGYTARRVEAAGGHSRKRWTIDTVCARRGVYRLGPMRLRLGDPFGLFEVVRDFEDAETFVVYPPVSRLPRLDLPRGTASGQTRVRRRALEWTTNASSVRHYVPGDELRAVHWPTSARREMLYVKEFELEPSGNVWVVVDLDAGVQAGQGSDSTEEYGIIFAASMVNAMLAENRAVGVAFSGVTPTLIPPSRGHDHMFRILRALALAQTGGDLTLGDFLARSVSSFGRGLTLVLVTPAVAGEWLGQLASLQRQGLAAHVILVDRATFLPAVDGVGALHSLTQRLAEMGVSLTRVEKGYHFDLVLRGPRQGHMEYVVGATGRLILRGGAEIAPG